MQIRTAQLADARQISELILSLKMQFLPDDSALQKFEVQAIAGFIVSPDVQYFVAEIDQQIVGVISLAKGSQLQHMFVLQQFQGHGYATQLWQYLLNIVQANAALKVLTVNASLNAVPVYECFGFKPADTGVMSYQGMQFLPMTYCLTTPVIQAL